MGKWGLQSSHLYIRTLKLGDYISRNHRELPCQDLYMVAEVRLPMRDSAARHLGDVESAPTQMSPFVIGSAALRIKLSFIYKYHIVQITYLIGCFCGNESSLEVG